MTLVKRVQTLTNQCYDLITFTCQHDEESSTAGGKKDAATSRKARAAVMRESRSIPAFIFAVERYTRFVKPRPSPLVAHLSCFKAAVAHTHTEGRAYSSSTIMQTLVGVQSLSLASTNGFRYEHFLIQMQKKSGARLLKTMKRSTVQSSSLNSLGAWRAFCCTTYTPVARIPKPFADRMPLLKCAPVFCKTMCRSVWRKLHASVVLICSRLGALHCRCCFV